MNTQKKLKVILTSSFLILSSPLFANTPDSFFKGYFDNKLWHPVMTLSAGAGYNSAVGESIYVPNDTDGVLSFFNYQNQNYNQSQALWGIFLGTEWLLKPTWSLQTGLSYYDPGTYKVKGNVTQGLDTETAETFSYHYNIHGHQLLADSKFLYNFAKYHPYLSAGLGIGWNRSENFAVNIQPAFTTFSNQFANNTTTVFTYQIGAGLDVDVTDKLRLGIGYLFSDLGKGSTAHGVIDTGGTSFDGTVYPAINTSTKLSQDHLYVQAFQVQLTLSLA